MSDPVVIPGEPETETTVIEPDTVIMEANPTIIIPTPEPEPELIPEPVVTHQCLTLAEVEEMMRRVLDDLAIEEAEPEPEQEPPKPPEHDTPPEPSHPFFRRRGGKH